MERGTTLPELTAAVQVQEAVEQLEVSTSEEPVVPDGHEVTLSTRAPEGLEGGREHANGRQCLERGEAGGVPHSARVLIRSLVERYSLTKEQLYAIHDECLSLRACPREFASATTSHLFAGVEEGQAAGVARASNCEEEEVGEVRGNAHVVQNSTAMLVDSHALPASAVRKTMEEEEEGGQMMGVTVDKPQEQGVEVGKMQTLVRSAIESFETSPSMATSELGAKRKLFSLEEELNMKPSPFAQELLE